MNHDRLPALDGWRGISITLVMAGHLLPIGPKGWGLNEAVAGAGMALFFILSGFLITSLLLADPRPIPFLVRRLARVLPLAWLVLCLTLWLGGPHELSVWLRHLGFTANWSPMALTVYTSHFWSLCVEVQFYVGAALVVALLGRRSWWWCLPCLALVVTVGRVLAHKHMVIDTQFRVDEILAGGCLALLVRHQHLPRSVGDLVVVALGGLLVAAAHADSGALNYARPYIAMALIGASLRLPEGSGVQRVLASRPLAYLASISYALYLFHGALRWTWLGTGDTPVIKYLKRPLLLAVTFGISHWSSRHYEAWFIRWSRRLTSR